MTKKLLKYLRKNRFFRLTLMSLKFFTLFLFGICIVSFLSALTLQFSIADLQIKRLMFWGLSLLFGGLMISGGMCIAIAAYEYGKDALKRRKQSRSDAQLEAFKAAKAQKEALGELETHYPGYMGAQDTFDVGGVAGIGYVYQQTFVDTYTRIAFVKLYDCKTSLVAADLLNDRVLPFFEGHGLRLLRILTDREAQYCGHAEHHQYQRYLSILGINHKQSKAKSPETNGICEEFHQTILEEFYEVMVREKTYVSLDELQRDVDHWLNYYNWERPHAGRYCYGKTPMQTFIDGVQLLKAQSHEPAPTRPTGRGKTATAARQSKQPKRVTTSASRSSNSVGIR